MNVLTSPLAGIALIALTAITGAADAQQAMSYSDARKQLFRENGRTVTIADLDFLGAAERNALEAYAGGFDYYAAMAVSPGDPADSGSAVAVANYHSAEAAQAAALSACEAKRRTGKACVVVATVTPRRYQARALTLSAEATAAIKDGYRKLDAPKAFAISPSSGAWAFARGDGGRALEQCRAKSQSAADCRIVVEDR